MRKRFLFVVLNVAFVSHIILADLHLTDGLTYDVDSIVYQDEYIYLDDNDQAVNSETQVNLMSGITIGLMEAYNHSRFNMYDGTVLYGISANDYSLVNISGGTSVFPLWADDYSTVSISGGYVERLSILGSSTVSISGGQIGDNLSAWDYSTVNISGGTIDGHVYAFDNSVVTVSGGDFGLSLWPVHNSKIYLVGTDFEVTVIGGSADLSYGDRVSDFGTAGTIRGRSMDYSADFEYQFYISGSNADIIVIPEPATLLLLGFGVIASNAIKNHKRRF